MVPWATACSKLCYAGPSVGVRKHNCKHRSTGSAWLSHYWSDKQHWHTCKHYCTQTERNRIHFPQLKHRSWIYKHKASNSWKWKKRRGQGGRGREKHHGFKMIKALLKKCIVFADIVASFDSYEILNWGSKGTEDGVLTWLCSFSLFLKALQYQRGNHIAAKQMFGIDGWWIGSLDRNWRRWQCWTSGHVSLLGAVTACSNLLALLTKHPPLWQSRSVTPHHGTGVPTSCSSKPK